MIQGEALWAVATVFLLGAGFSMCIRCKRSKSEAVIRQNRIYEQSQQNDNFKQFEVVRSFTVKQGHTQRQPAEPPTQDVVKPPNNPFKDDLHKYENVVIASETEQDSTYVNPIATDYYNLGTGILSPPKDDDEDCSYQNVTVCNKIGNTESDDDDDDYENSDYIEKWSQKKQVSVDSQMDSPDNVDEEYSDYVNTIIPTSVEK
nr:PREDICTED: linker for activation of T-cells family member 2 isoform X3 [Latimeria chalumnae]|eukprot:XP_014353228.1 PREDICTED: linker for activation of T-cells family member 2 isoform X3 [Latimeria chalumnae]